MFNKRPRRGGSYHWREYRIEEFLPSADSGRDVLLLGCGDGGERPHLANRGFRTTGVDIKRSPGADVVADAHGLPFGDGSFDLVLSMQVLEHLYAPWVAIQEIARVLRPDGWFVGSVAFLKPYHKSYFHMTHRVVRSLLESAGLRPGRFKGAQSLTYSIYGGMLPLGSVRFRRALFGLIDRALTSVRVLAWSILRRENPNLPTDRFSEGMALSFSTFERLRRAPAVVFSARKPGNPTVKGAAKGAAGKDSGTSERVDRTTGSR